MQKIKKPISILLSVLMVLSVFAVVPFTASAAELAGYVMVQNLSVGDIIGGDVQRLYNSNYTLTLEANRYGDYFGKKTEATVTSSFDFSQAHGSDPVRIFDMMNGYNRYYPYDENGNRCEAFIVTAVDHSARTFSLAGYLVPDNPVLLNSSVKYRYCDGTAFHTGNTPAASTYKVDTGNRKWTNNSWYVVTENVTFEKRIEIKGTVNLILCDGATLTAKQGISVNKGDYNPSAAGALNIYAQNGGTGALYAGTANGTSTTMNESPQRAAIGGDDNNTNGNITIHGGNIYAISNIGTAGIGGGQNSDGGNVTIYGGNVTAGNQNSYGSGIGGGYHANAGNINILGGTVTAFATGQNYDAAFGSTVTDRTVNLTIPEGATMVAGNNADSAVATTVDEYKANRKIYARVEAGELPNYYTVDWKNDDGSILKTKEFAAGTTPTYDGTTPTKEDDDNAYTFTGWDPAVTEVTGNATYTATFDATPYVASVTSNGTTTKYTDFGTAVSNWTNGSTLTLLANVERNSTINVTGTQTLDLNGYGIKMTGNSNVINVGSANLTLNDSNPSKTHKFDPPSGGVGLATLNEENGALTINGGYITGGCNVEYGGGILVGAGRLTMNGGNIIGNKANRGGGVSVWRGAGTFTLNGGSVSYNEGTNLGGGIMSYGSGEHPNQGLLKINGGSVQYNTCPKSGGIFSQTAMELSGSPNISGNKETSGKDSNLTFYGNTNLPGEYMYCIIKVTGELTPVTPIGVTRLTTGEGGVWETPCAGVFTASDNTSFNDAGKFKSDDVNYKVVKNADGQLELKPALFVGHSISLNGDVTLNFFINPKAKGVNNFNNYKNAKVTFTWDKGQGQEYGTKSVNLLDPEDKNVSVDPTTGCYKVSCNVAAAHMGHKVLAELYLDTTEPVETNAYSVREYAEIIWKNPSQYDTKNKPTKLQNLVQAMLNYGAMSQVVFEDDLADNTVELVNKVVGDNGYKDVTSDDIAAKIKPGASDLKEVATQLGAKYYTTSLLYLSENKLRVYFTPTTYPGQIPNSRGFTGNKAGYYYYKESAPIAAADLDEQQTLSVNGVDIKVSALDYAKVIVENKNNQMNETQINLAKALFLYNQAANAYFV